MAKTYASRRRHVPIYEFTMVFVRNGIDEPHDFEARAVMDWKDNVQIVPLVTDTARGGNPAVMLPNFDRMIRRALRDDDGTPARWEPRIVEANDRRWFTDPAGDHVEGNDVDALLPKYLDFTAGSSRRRWVHLMDCDDDLTIDSEQIMELIQDLTEAAGKDLSQRLEASSG